TDTTASVRGFISPLTLIRMDAFRGSETSCIFAIAGPGGAAPALARGPRRARRPSRPCGQTPPVAGGRMAQVRTRVRAEREPLLRGAPALPPLRTARAR